MSDYKPRFSVGARVLFLHGYKFIEGTITGVTIDTGTRYAADSEFNVFYRVKGNGLWSRNLWMRGGDVKGSLSGAVHEVESEVTQ